MLSLQSYLTLCKPTDCSLARLLCPWDSPGKNTGVGYHALLQGTFPTQGSNLHLLCLCIVGRFFTMEPPGDLGPPNSGQQKDRVLGTPRSDTGAATEFPKWTK